MTHLEELRLQTKPHVRNRHTNRKQIINHTQRQWHIINKKQWRQQKAQNKHTVVNKVVQHSENGDILSGLKETSGGSDLGLGLDHAELYVTENPHRNKNTNVCVCVVTVDANMEPPNQTA